MKRELKVSKSIIINANVDQVWNAMTNPGKIKVYLYGTEAITDWKEGSQIIFQGNYNGNQYVDKGKVLKNKRPHLLKYSYWSGFSGLPDKPENYAIIDYVLEGIKDGRVKLTWKQEGFANEEGQLHSEIGLPGMLEEIRKLIEKREK